MRFCRAIKKWYGSLHPISRLSFKLGAALMTCFYITGLVSYLTAFHVANWEHAMAVYSGSMQAAPASLAAGVCAGLLGDLLVRKSGGKNNDD